MKSQTPTDQRCETIHTTPSGLSKFLSAALGPYGLGDDELGAVIEHITEANLMGVDSHGLQQVPGYTRSLESGRIRPDAMPSVRSDQGSVLVLDGAGGFGHWVGKVAALKVVERARRTGIAAVACVNSNHFGMAGFYGRLATQAGMAAFVTSDTNVVDLVVGEQKRPRLGNDPICWAIPTGTEAPLVLDGAAGAVSGGKLRDHFWRGLPLATDWAVDAEGRPTQKAAVARYALAAGPKQWGLALVADLLCGPLLGTAAATFKDKAVHNGENGTGHLFIALNVAFFTPVDQFLAGVRALLDSLKQAGPGETALHYPGELEWLTKKERLIGGIPIPVRLYEELSGIYGRDSAALLEAPAA